MDPSRSTTYQKLKKYNSYSPLLLLERYIPPATLRSLHPETYYEIAIPKPQSQNNLLRLLSTKTKKSGKEMNSREKPISNLLVEKIP